MSLYPDSSFVEANDCHNPAGPGGGRFCSKRGAPRGVLDVEEERARRDFGATITVGDIGSYVTEDGQIINLEAGLKPKAALTTLRHELGHLDQTPLKNDTYVAGLRRSDLVKRLGPTGAKIMVEEIRAWRNTVRDGRVSWPVLMDYLGSHFARKYTIASPTAKAERADRAAAKRDLNIVVNHLKRYARFVR